MDLWWFFVDVEWSRVLPLVILTLLPIALAIYILCNPHLCEYSLKSRFEKKIARGNVAYVESRSVRNKTMILDGKRMSFPVYDCWRVCVKLDDKIKFILVRVTYIDSMLYHMEDPVEIIYTTNLFGRVHVERFSKIN